MFKRNWLTRNVVIALAVIAAITVMVISVGSDETIRVIEGLVDIVINLLPSPS